MRDSFLRFIPEKKKSPEVLLAQKLKALEHNVILTKALKRLHDNPKDSRRIADVVRILDDAHDKFFVSKSDGIAAREAMRLIDLIAQDGGMAIDERDVGRLSNRDSGPGDLSRPSA